MKNQIKACGLEAIEMIYEGDTVAAHSMESESRECEGPQANYVVGQVMKTVQPGEDRFCKHAVECYQIRIMLEVKKGKTNFRRSGFLHYVPVNGTTNVFGKPNNLVHTI